MSHLSKHDFHDFDCMSGSRHIQECLGMTICKLEGGKREWEDSAQQLQGHIVRMLTEVAAAVWAGSADARHSQTEQGSGLLLCTDHSQWLLPEHSLQDLLAHREHALTGQC